MPWQTDIAISNFIFAGSFLTGVELHSKQFIATFIHIYVMGNIGLVFVVCSHKIPKNEVERAHTFEQEMQF